jgi:hypothetical protein
VKLVPKTVPQPDGTTIHDVYMTFREKHRLMTVWIASFRHQTDLNEWLELQAAK